SYVKVELLQRPLVGLRHKLASGRDVRLRDEQPTQPHNGSSTDLEFPGPATLGGLGNGLELLDPQAEVCDPLDHVRPAGTLTFDQICHHGAVVVSRLLLSVTDLKQVSHVSSDVGQETCPGIHLSLKEAEQRILDVLHCAL
ncbi:hypothetical protein EGW08_015095, partial [Elysia chlorotica]